MDSGEEHTGDNLREEQLKGLRRLVLPGLTFLLHNVLHTSEQFTECLKLADIVTSEHYKLFQVGLKHIDRHADAYTRNRKHTLIHNCSRV